MPLDPEEELLTIRRQLATAQNLLHDMEVLVTDTKALISVWNKAECRIAELEQAIAPETTTVKAP